MGRTLAPAPKEGSYPGEGMHAISRLTADNGHLIGTDEDSGDV